MLLRQVIGLREYVKLLYDYQGEELRKQNRWNCEDPLPPCFYEGEVALPSLDSERVRERATLTRAAVYPIG